MINLEQQNNNSMSPDESDLLLFKETTSFLFEVTEETKANISDKTKPLDLVGIIQRCDVLNKNGRVYTRDILVNEVMNYKKNFVDQNCAWGELDHVDEPIVHAKNACILFKEIWIKDNDVYGKIRVLNNANGDIVRSMIEAGGRPGISSRAVGSLRDGFHNGRQIKYVNDDLQIICWDIVTDPSTPGAFMGLSESRTLSNKEVRALNEYNVRHNISKKHSDKKYSTINAMIDTLLL